MKVLFLASIRGKDQYIKDYELVVDVLNNTGNEIISDHVMKNSQEDLDTWTRDKKIDFHENIFDYVKKTDVVIGEVTYSSMGVGYLIAMALDLGKPTILLYRSANEPNLISTLTSYDKLQAYHYDFKNLKKDLPTYLDYAKKRVDTRFTFFISPAIEVYLSWVSRERHIPRSVFIRSLIENYMKHDVAYSKPNK